MARETSLTVNADHLQLLDVLLKAFNSHVLGNDKKAFTLVSKPLPAYTTKRDDFVRHFQEGLKNYFNGMSLRYENIDYARQKALNSLTHFNSALESMFENMHNRLPEDLEEQIIAYIYKLVLTELEKVKESDSSGVSHRDAEKIRKAIAKWPGNPQIQINQEEILLFLLLIFSKSVAQITILNKLQPWPKEIQKKRGLQEPKVKDELERLLNIFTFFHLIAKNSHKLPIVIERDVSRLFGAMGYFYRAKTFFLLSDYDHDNFRKSFNDLTCAERIIVTEVQEGAKKENSLDVCWKWFSASIHFAKGYLYQRAFASVQAFENFHEGMQHYSDDFSDEEYSLNVVENQVALGKIFIELGKFKSALYKFLKALEKVFIISAESSSDEKTASNLRSLRKAILYLKGIRQDEIINKKKILALLSGIDSKVLLLDSFSPLKVLVSDICSRIGFVLFLFFQKTENIPKQEVTEVDKWLEVAMQLDPNNGVAQFNRLLLGTKKDISNELHFRNDTSIRRFLAVALETLVNSPNHEGLKEERNFFKQSITYSDSLIKKPLEINYYLSPDRKEKKDSVLFLKRWSSSSPRVPRPTTFQMRGGGYLIFWNNKGIAIDPGFDFITNLYSQGYSISDIDAIIVTHDHIDHTDDFDAILALNYQLNRYNESTYLKPKPPVCLSLFLNTSFMERYTPYLSLKTRDSSDAASSADGYIDYIDTLAPHSIIDMRDTDFRMKIEVIPAHHREITHDKYAVGFKLVLCDKGGKENLSLGFTSDTAYYESLGEKIRDCDFVIPHLGFVTFRELGQLMDLDIDQVIQGASSQNFGDLEEELRFFSALGFRDVKSWDDLKTKWKAGSKESHQGFLRQHLGYTGIKKIWEKMVESTTKQEQLLIISELHEEMGSFRSKIATSFNDKAKSRNCQNAPISFTSDIGLHLLFQDPEENSRRRAKIRCTSCASDNDISFEESFHDPKDITEVCIKGENEGIFYFCKEHITNPKQEFREKVERFNLFI